MSDNGRLNAEQAMRAFRATITGHAPLVDTRTPADIKAQKEAGNLR